MIGSLQLFDLVWVMTGGGPVDASNTMATYLIDWGFRRSEFGYASAVSVIVFTLSLVVALAYQRWVLRRDIEGATRDGSPMSAKPRAAQWVTRAVPLPRRVHRPGRDHHPGGLRGPRRLPRHPAAGAAIRSGSRTRGSLENYESVLQSGSFWRQLANSTLIALLTTLFVLPAASLAAFVIARFSFRGREAVYTLFTLGLLFPIAVAILPLFVVIRQLELLNSPLGVALPQAAFALPLSIVILRPFFASIPRELEEAAILDGARPAPRLLVGVPAAVAPRDEHGRRPDARHELERVPPAARRPHPGRQLDASRSASRTSRRSTRPTRLACWRSRRSR